MPREETASESDTNIQKQPKKVKAKRSRVPPKKKEKEVVVADDAASISTSDILSVDHTFFVLSQFFMAEPDKKNITTVLSEINEKLGTLIKKLG